MSSYWDEFWESGPLLTTKVIKWCWNKPVYIGFPLIIFVVPSIAIDGLASIGWWLIYGSRRWDK